MILNQYLAYCILKYCIITINSCQNTLTTITYSLYTDFCCLDCFHNLNQCIRLTNSLKLYPKTVPSQIITPNFTYFIIFSV